MAAPKTGACGVEKTGTVARHSVCYIAASLLVAILAGLTQTATAATFQVEPDSQGNRLYLVISHRELAAPLEDISAIVTDPSFATFQSPLYLPESVGAGSARLAGFEFEVDSVPVGQTDDVTITVIGSVHGVSFSVDHVASLMTVATAPPLQGVIGSDIPGIEELDTDGDGVPDLEEIEQGHDPFDPLDPYPAPPTPPFWPPVPALDPLGIALLVVLLAAAGCALLLLRARVGRPGRGGHGR